MQKTCSRCLTTQDISNFAKAKVNKDGRSGQCRACRTEIQRERRRTDPAYAEKQRQIVRDRRAEGRRSPSEALRPRPVADERRAILAGRVTAANYNAKRFSATPQKLVLAEVWGVFESAGWKCRYCESPEGLWIDHVVPLSRGGANTPDNIVPACEDCNRRKSINSAENFLSGKCSAGHDRTQANVYVYPNGTKTACKTCRRMAQARSRAGKKGS